MYAVRRKTAGYGAIILTATLLLAGCNEPTPYEPAAETGDATGYESTQVANDRYRISFEGNAQTPRKTVETYLLYRAAEIADQTNHPYFAIIDDDTEKKVDVNVYDTAPGFYGYGTGLGFGPGFGSFPYAGRMAYGGPTVTTSDSYEAGALVEMFDQRPSDRSDVFETDTVLTNLKPQINFPAS